MMKTLNDYMAMPYRMEIVEDKDEGGFVVSYPDLPGCITCGETVESAVVNALDAKKAWLEAALEDGVDSVLEIMIAKHLCYGYNEVATNWQQKSARQNNSGQ